MGNASISVELAFRGGENWLWLSFGRVLLECTL